MLHAGLSVFDAHRRTEFEHFDVRWFDERLQRCKIYRARARRTMVTSGELHVMNMKANEAVGQRFQVHRMLNEPEVFLYLRVAGVMPVTEAGAGDIAK